MVNALVPGRSAPCPLTAALRQGVPACCRRLARLLATQRERAAAEGGKAEDLAADAAARAAALLACTFLWCTAAACGRQRGLWLCVRSASTLMWPLVSHLHSPCVGKITVELDFQSVALLRRYSYASQLQPQHTVSVAQVKERTESSVIVPVLTSFAMFVGSSLASAVAAAAAMLDREGSGPTDDAGRAGCATAVTLRFVHRPEWLQQGARLILRSCGDGCAAGAGIVQELHWDVTPSEDLA